MAKAREWVPSFFGIPGKMKSTEVKDIVAWLLKDGRYKYSEVDIQVSGGCHYFFLLLKTSVRTKPVIPSFPLGVRELLTF